MPWLFRSLLVLVFLGLAVFAALPYLPNIQREAEHIYHTWQKIRAGKPVVVASENPEPKTLKTKSNRSRTLLTPELLDNDEIEPQPSEDPFISEARLRAREDPIAAMEWIQNQSSGGERLRGMLEVVALWAAEDSEAALLWLESNAQGLARMETLNSGVELWAERNPTAAADWIDGMANDGSKVTAAKSLASKWVQTQPEEASAWVTSLPNGTIRSQAAAALAESWAKLDPEAASIWAFAEAEFNGDTDLLVTTVQTYTKQAPEAAEAFLRDMTEATDAPAVLASHVLARAEQDPAATAEWLTQLSPNDPIYSSEYANGLMQIWAESDSIAASEWLSQQPQGEQRDAAVYGFSESIQRFEPEAAAAWANTIDNPEQRVIRLQESISTWAKTQPAEAINWVKTADLEPALREQLASQIPWD